ncbi:hypothetical protein [Jiangella anatolica]|uniref:Uncharacterized protein n=1 Tax=Jiangella anatolica TaxID=2670374 RepID=A0A2W2C9E9_9ACTN|nr:hypothetical protein [Jiangella anatolica]PZF84827.1 hypothetical protein C1I92_07110 [Jiangella anatolica]
MDPDNTSAAPGTGLTRRTLMGLGASAVTGLVLGSNAGTAAAKPAASAAAAGGPLAPVAPYDPATLVRGQFAPEEQRLARFLVTLPDLANKMDLENEETYGWFNGGYWRTPLVPYNANIQQSVYTLSWFYTQQREWNPYYLDPALRDRIYAGIRFYLSLQGPDGWFPAWSYVDRNRDVTAYALVFLGETALLLESVGWADDIRSEVLAALVRAADYVLDPANEDVWTIGPEFSNQVIPALMGVWMVRHLLPARILRAYEDRMTYYVENAQSEGAGYLYESAAFDAHYALYVTTRMFARLYGLNGDERLKQMQLEHFDWCRFNYLWEPDGAGFTVNGISTRLSMRSLPSQRTTDESSYPDLLNVWAADSPVAVALNWDREHVDGLRSAWAAATEPLTPMGNPVDPMNIWFAEQRAQTFATREQRMQAIRSFPYFGRPFVEARSDTRYDQHYLFVNRQGYYFASHHGNVAKGSTVPKGPSFFYHHTTGAFVATQMATDSVWSTRLSRDFVDAEARMLKIRGDVRQTLPFDYTYYTYRPSGGSVAKTFHCLPDKLAVDVETNESSFVERLPLVIAPDDDVRWLLAGGGTAPVENGAGVQAVGIRVGRTGGAFELRLAAPLRLSLTASTITLFSGARQRTIKDLDIAATASTLSYSLQIRPR